MKRILTLTVATFTSACAANATINGFVLTGGSFNVPSTNIMALQAVSFVPTTPTNDLYITINGAAVVFRNATNGLWTLPKALLLPGGSSVTIPASGGVVFGALINPSDAPLFVGVDSSLDSLALAGNTLTGVLQLSRTAAGSKVLFQSSTNLVDWGYDTSVVVQHGSDNTKWQFTVPLTGPQHFYRALVRRNRAG